MTINKISSNQSSEGLQNSIESVRSNLEALAKLHNVSVDDLVKSAQSAGPDAPAYLNRALVLSKRLDKLEANS